MSFENSSFRKTFMLIAGPCALENAQQVQQSAKVLQAENLPLMRGGIYKMRTNPDSFQGLGKQAIKLAALMKKNYNLKMVSEVTDPRHIPSLSDVVDIFQVGTRNMYNYELLKELGRQGKPVLLKRAFSATVKEWLLAAQYIAHSSNKNIILCERGIRTFETSTRNTIDLSGALMAKKESGWPVILDPSHGTGRMDLVIPMASAGIACGLDGLLIEIHPEPAKALSDGKQSLNFSQFHLLMKQVRKLLPMFNRSLLEQTEVKQNGESKSGYEKFFCRPSSKGHKEDIQLYSS